ncbi:MAG: nuclear transport factor 2 family protein [Chloroflexota bacterium]
MKNTKLARALFDAFAAGHIDAVRELCDANLQAYQNGGLAMGLDALCGFVAAVQGVVKHFRYEDIICSETATGFVEEHSVRGMLPDGEELDLTVCVVAEISGGKIVTLREYVDSAKAVGLIKALS